MKNICFIAASGMTITAFLMKHVEALSEHRAISIVTNTPADFLVDSGVQVRVIPLAIQREISPWLDLKALWQLWWLFRREKFDSIHSITPKAGLLAMVAGWLACVPIRIHSFSGQVWATRSGFMRALLKTMDKITVRLATHLISDSESQYRFLESEGVVKGRRVVVLAKGSISGVDLERFHPDAKMCKSIRRQLGLSDRSLVFLYLGRIKRDKGVLDLASAFHQFAGGVSQDVSLLVVGPDEDGLLREIMVMLGTCAEQVRILPYTNHPENFMMASDVFCLPSYRESFGITVIEAASCGIPAIGSRIYGVTDAIEEGKSGLLFPAANVEELRRCMLLMMHNESLRKAMGEYARERAENDFSSERVTQAWLEYYDALL